MLVLMMLTVSTRSLGQNNCFGPNQMKKMNEFRTECENCQLDLEDTRMALDECVAVPIQRDQMTAFATGIGGMVFGLIIGSIISNNK